LPVNGSVIILPIPISHWITGKEKTWERNHALTGVNYQTPLLSLRHIALTLLLLSVSRASSADSLRQIEPLLLPACVATAAPPEGLTGAGSNPE